MATASSFKRGRLRRQGCAPARLHGRDREGWSRGELRRAGADPGLRRGWSRRARLRAQAAVASARGRRRDVLFFTQELSTLLNAGVPLDRALSITGGADRAAGLPHRRAGRAARAQGRQVAGGQPGHASGVFLGPVHQHGARGRGLGRAGGDLRAAGRSSSARATTCAATSSRSMIYPALLALVGLASILVLLNFVVPRFAAVFERVRA